MVLSSRIPAAALAAPPPSVAASVPQRPLTALIAPSDVPPAVSLGPVEQAGWGPEYAWKLPRAGLAAPHALQIQRQQRIQLELTANRTAKVCHLHVHAHYITLQWTFSAACSLLVVCDMKIADSEAIHGQGCCAIHHAQSSYTLNPRLLGSRAGIPVLVAQGGRCGLLWAVFPKP